MAAGHLITNRDFSLLGNVNADGLVYTWGKFITVFSCKYFCIYDNTVSTVRYL